VAKAKLASMSVDALLKLREDIEKVLTRKVRDLKDQLARLGHEVGPRTRVSSLKGRSVPVKYRDKSGNTWAGRGAQPVWLRERLRDGAKLEDFAVHKNAGRKTHRRAKR
jgi:DNA-binding protein H-NS